MTGIRKINMIARPRSASWILLVLATIGPRGMAADKVQPDRLDFGVVRVGARVEGSVRIFVDPEDAREKTAKVEPPAFVRTREVKVGTQSYGAVVKGFCDIAVTVDAGRAGVQSGKIVATIGGRRVEVPVSAVVLPNRAGLTRVLVADTPFHGFSTDDSTLFNAWRKVVERGELDVDYVEARWGAAVLRGIDLARYDVVLLGGTGIVSLTEADVASLRRFAEAGGRLIVTANHFYRGSVTKANALLLPHGLEIEDTEPPGADHTFEPGPSSIMAGPLTEGVKALSFSRASPIQILAESRAAVLVAGPKDGRGCVVAYARAGEGEVVALSQSLWWSWAAEADNATLLGNLLRKRPRSR